MWTLWLSWAAASPTCGAAVPLVAPYRRTALDEQRSEDARASAILALGEMCTPDANSALDEIIRQVGAWSSLGRVAVTARVEHAPLADLANVPWPDWASRMVAARIEQEVPVHCDDPEIWRLRLPSEVVAQACGGRADVPALVRATLADPTPEVRAQSARLLSDLMGSRGDELGTTLLDQLRWRPQQDLPLVEGAAVLGTLVMAEALRGAVATELVCWRISLVLVGGQRVPARLDSELSALLAPERFAYGEPTHTIDWLYLLSAAGPDPGPILDRLGVRGDRAYASALDDLRTLSGSPRTLLPLLGHRSPILRARAAERLEAEPNRALAALNRATRWAPGRTFPLRGDLVVPRLPRTPAQSEAWTERLMEWVALASSRLDTAALRAVLCLLTEPTNTNALHASSRQNIARKLLAAAEHERDPVRAALLAQAMDAVLRRVPLADGLAPAPDQVRSW